MRLIWDGRRGGKHKWAGSRQWRRNARRYNDKGDLTAAVNCIFVLMRCFPAQKNMSCFGSLIRTIFIFHLMLGNQMIKRDAVPLLWKSTMRSWGGRISCRGAIFGHLSISVGAAAQHGGSSDSLHTLWEASIFEWSPPDIKTTCLVWQRPHVTAASVVKNWHNVSKF